MALIGSIRKHFWFVLILLGMALAAFVMMDMMGSKNMGGASQMTLGEIDGVKVDYRDFQTAEQALYANSNSEVYSRRTNLWNYFVEKALVEKNADKLGLGVSHEELMDLQFGQNLSPIIQQNWRNPQTGQIDRAQLQQFKTAIENNQELSPTFRLFWAEQEKQIIKTQLQEKLSTMAQKAIYTPAWMAEMIHGEQNQKIDFSFVKIPFDQVADTEVEVTDADYSAFIKKNIKKYTNDEETRTVDYVVFDVIPSAQDTAQWTKSIADLIPQFSSTSSDSTFAVNNNGNYQNYYFKTDELTDSLEQIVPRMEVGSVYGPVIENGNILAVKLVDKMIVPDSVKARHILKSVPQGNAVALAKANAEVDSILNLLRTSRTAQFDSLAMKHSDDQGSKVLGGDLGYFTQGRMVPEFNEVCFITGSPNKYYKVQSEFGVHLIEINDQIFTTREPKYKIALIRQALIPSETTQEANYDKAIELIGSYPYLDALKGELDKLGGIKVNTARNLKKNDYNFATLGADNSSRDIVRWAFDGNTNTNDVSPEVYRYSDPVNYVDTKYVIVGLSEIVKAGVRSVASVKDEISKLVLNEKKGEYLKNKVAGKDLNAVAAAFNGTIEQATNVSMGSGFIPSVGNEPKVISTAFNTDLNAIATSVGNSGLFVVSPVNKVADTSPANIPLLRMTNASGKKSQLPYQLMEAMKKGAEIKDNRFTFF